MFSHFHACLLQLESTIKQAEEERERQMDAARRIHEDFGARLLIVNQMRAHMGLEKAEDTREANWRKEWVFPSEASFSTASTKSSAFCLTPNVFASQSVTFSQIVFLQLCVNILARLSVPLMFTMSSIKTLNYYLFDTILYYSKISYILNSR